MTADGQRLAAVAREPWELAIRLAGGDVGGVAQACGLATLPQDAQALWGALSRGDLEHLPPLAASQERFRVLPTHQPARAHLTHQRLVGVKGVPCLPWRC